MKSQSVVVFPAKEKAELQPKEVPQMLGTNEVRGKTLFSLISAGTEVTGAYIGNLGDIFPIYPGYAAVFRIEECGTDVKGFEVGDIAFCMGNHQSFQQQDSANVLRIPDGLAPEKAPFARMMGVSMTTLMTTTARPGDIVMITGLGPVGYLAAQMFRRSGYEVVVVDPDEKRRKYAENSGIEKVFASVPVSDTTISGKVALVVECSGHEQAVLDACKVVRRRGEVVLVGVPWARRSDAYAHTLLHLVFHNYVVLRSGWEWEIPRHTSEFSPYSIFSNFSTALNWLNDGSINIDHTYFLANPRDAQTVYQDILHNRSQSLFTLFDWK